MDDHEMEESVGSEHLDRLSELPESLILHILSFLTMRDVVSTTLLSKRWENLWTTLPCLNFSDIIIIEDDESESDTHNDRRDEPTCIRNFVNRALMFWKGTKLLKFTIEIEYHFDKSLAGDMDLWVRFAVLNNVEELNISWLYLVEIAKWEEAVDSNKDVYIPPQCLNLCSSIKKLSLYGCNFQIHGSLAWKMLKSLKIDGFYLPELLINQILLGTPQLEVFEFRVIDSRMNLNITSTSLKKLKIETYLFFDEPSLNTVLRICCPNLETLEISGVFFGEYLFTNVSSLTDVTLLCDSNLYMALWNKLLGERMRRIFSTFQHVQKVTLSLDSFEMIGASQKNNLFSPLPNVEFLEVEVYLNELVKMVNLLGMFPNLKTLVIKDCTYQHSENYSKIEANISRSFLPQLKIIEITSSFCCSSTFQCIEFLLKHCRMLEKLVVRAKRYSSHPKALEIAERLLRMPRSSPTADVIFNKR
ncbi:hypothetical protein ACS0TY_008707 [Phlomoides rotata]